MSDFDLQKYIQFIESKFITKEYYNSKIFNNDIINSLIQFEQPIYEFLKIHKQSSYKLFKKRFGNINKPLNVSYNRYFLFIYGYKYCIKCKKILDLSKFNSRNNTSDQKNNICKNCTHKYYIKNSEHFKSYSRQYRKNNKDIVQTYYKSYAKKNNDKFNFYTAKRRAKKLQATPVWLTIEHWKQIKELYKLAKKLIKETGILHVVDHIIPLQGKYVSGLHVPWNLQIISSKENGNKYNYHVSEEYWK